MIPLDHASTKWKGCRELNSDLKVRSLAPSIRWTTSPIVGRRCRTRTDIQSLEGSVLILLNEAPSCTNLVRDAGIEPASSRLKGECISASANPAKLWWVTLATQHAQQRRALGTRWNRTSLVSLKRRVHQPSLPVTRTNSGRLGGTRTHMNLIRSQVPDPFSHTPSCKSCRMLESNQRLAIIDRGLPPPPREHRARWGPRARPSS